MSTPLVIDLSHWNGVDTLADAKAAGIAGVIHKATEGSTYKDPTYAARRSEALSAGLLFGAYHFLRPGSMQQQADFFLSVSQPDGATLLAADHEDAGVSLGDLKAFLRAVADRCGHLPILYSGYVIKQQVGSSRDDELSRYALWLAQYTTGKPQWPTATWPSWFLWQYSDKGKVAGINGDVDVNAFDGDAVDLMTVWPSGHAVEPAPAPRTVQVALRVPEGVAVEFTVNDEAAGTWTSEPPPTF
jgi:lysozyme